MANWTSEQNPFGQNRTPVIMGWASDNSGIAIPVAVDKATGRLLVNATGASGGTSSTFGAAFPTLGTAVGASDGTNMQPLLVDGSGYLEVNVKAGGGGGTQYTDAGTPPTHPIGNAIEWNNAGTWATTGSANPLPISGTVTANAGTNLNTSALATSANQTNATQKTQIVDGSGNVIASTTNALNVAVIAGSSVIGHVITDSGSVTGATLSAETTKVIGVTRTADGAGNLLTSNSTTYTAKFGLDANLLGTLGTAFSTAGKVDVKGADGDVFVRQTTGTNLHVVTDSTSTTAVTQATASSLNAQVVGAGAQNAAVTGNPVLEASYASAAEPSNVGADGRAQYPWLDQKGRQIVAFQAGTNTNSSVGGSATSVSLLSANTARKGATIYNDSSSVLYIAFNATSVSTTAYLTQIPGSAYYEVPFGYTGAIFGIWSSATGNARINEVT